MKKTKRVADAALLKAHKNILQDPLVGKFFHTYPDGVLEHQGEILARLDDGTYLVQLYEFLMGTASEQYIERLANMAGWKFYDSLEDWHYAYERYRQQCEVQSK